MNRDILPRHACRARLARVRLRRSLERMRSTLPRPPLVASLVVAVAVLAGTDAGAESVRPDASAIGARGVVADSTAEADRYDPWRLVSRIRYTVAPGDTLFGIAQEYGVSVSDIRRWNNLSGDGLRPGQTLSLYVSGRSSRVRIEHSVKSGETGLGIALKYGVRLDALRRWNPRANLDRLRVGQELNVYVSGGGSAASSSRGASASGPTAIGSTNGGRLLNGVLLEDGPGFDVRSATNAYGMPVTVDAIRYAFARLMAVFPDTPRVEVGDLSRETGGRFGPHHSHQNGLDADIAYFARDAKDYCEFASLAPEDLDVERQWYLFELWLEWGAVEFLFVDYELQAPLYEYAAAQGYSDAQLAEWFQWPRGRNTRRGIIRHEPGHDNHVHARFVEGVQVATAR